MLLRKLAVRIWKVGGCYRKSQTSCHETKKALEQVLLRCCVEDGSHFLEREDIGREANIFCGGNGYPGFFFH